MSTSASTNTSTITTRCPSCKGLNRVPTERVSESPKCGKCQTALLDGAPIEGTELNIEGILNSDVPVVIDFWALGVIHVLDSLLSLVTQPKSLMAALVLLKSILKLSKCLVQSIKFAAFQLLWCLKAVSALMLSTVHCQNRSLING